MSTKKRLRFSEVQVGWHFFLLGDLNKALKNAKTLQLYYLDAQGKARAFHPGILGGSPECADIPKDTPIIRIRE